MQIGFSYIGLIMLAMLFVPNIIWTKNKPVDYDKYQSKENKILLAFERVGQCIVTVSALIFSSFNPHGWSLWCLVLILAFLNLVVYDIAWIRCFRSDKTMKDFYKGFLGMPLALATYPVIAFYLLGLFGGNIILIFGSVVLGVGHIGIHAMHAREVYGKKPKKKLVLRILKWIGIAVLALILISLNVFITGRCFRQIKRYFTYRSGVNEEIYVTLNDQEEYVVISGKNVNNPVIISLHGGPGSPTTFIDYCWQDYLTDEYTLVSWDERGCGRSYYRNMDTDPDNRALTFEQQLEDLDALVDYCCDRFGQDKVIILGHSYGSLLGSEYVFLHPDKVSAYIGVGQCVNENGYFGEIYSYQDALSIAKERGDDTSEMEAAYAAFLEDMSTSNLLTLRTLVAPYHPQTETTDVSTYAALTSPIVGTLDLKWYMLEIASLAGDSRFEELEQPLTETLESFVLEDKYQVPVLFISGSCDWICPADLVREFAEEGGYTYAEMEGCGHAPQGQLPEDFAGIIKSFLKDC